VTCTSSGNCPSIQTHTGGYLIVGTAVTASYAAGYGANVGSDEAAILLPAEVMAAHEKPLHQRIAQLRSEVKDLYARLADHERGCEHEAWESRHAAELALVKAERDTLARLHDRHAQRLARQHKRAVLPAIDATR
jgi:hypothetical protein